MDEGAEFKNKLWEAYCCKRGIIHEITAPHSSAANGVAERQNCTILNLARSMLSNSRLPEHYWGEATATTVYVLDLVLSSRHLGKTPHEIRTGHKLDIVHLQPFGYTAYAQIPCEDGGSKLDVCSVKTVMVGYFGEYPHRTLPDNQAREGTDLYKVFDIQEENGTTDQNASSTDNQPAPQTDCPPADHDKLVCPTAQASPTEGPHRSNRLAAKWRNSSEARTENLPDSKKETYASMPGALVTQTNVADNL